MAVQSVVLGTDADGDETMTITEDGRNPYTVDSQSVLDRYAATAKDLKILKQGRDQKITDGDDPSYFTSQLQSLRPKFIHLSQIIVLYNQAKGL